MIEILFAVAIGFAIGIITGILPGLHPNNVIPIILGLSFIFDSITLSFILLTAGIVNIFVNFIPSILVGAPDDSAALSVLPGHKMLLDGRGYEAIQLASIGCLGGIVFAVLILPIFALTIPIVYKFIRPQMHWILIAAVGFLISMENNKSKALLVFILAGFLGLIVLGTSSNNLFPLLTGLFGMPTLLISLRNKINLPKVFKVSKIKIDKKSILHSVSVGGIAGIVAGLLPGLGATQSTALTQQFFKKKMDLEKFLISLGAVSTSDLIYSILALWLIGNPRSGIAVAIGNLIQLDIKTLLIFLSLIITVAFVSYRANLFLSKRTLKLLSRFNYTKICLFTITFILSLVLFFTGLFGILILGVSTTIGLLANFLDVRRTNCMGCLLLPTILFFAGII